MHGIEDSSDSYVMNEPKKAVAFILSDLGYDVWMGNNRGNIYSDRHVTMSKKTKEFWQFDFEDMGTKDIPAIADFIKSTTGVSKMTYIGHSEGTT